MIFQRYADLFEICWPVFWPWLWLQLSILTAQKAEDGRERLIMGTWWGKVYVLAVGDDPNRPPNDPLTPFRGPRSVPFMPLLAAKFPGDTPELATRTEAAHRALTCLWTSPIHAPATPATCADTQDKTHILAPG